VVTLVFASAVGARHSCASVRRRKPPLVRQRSFAVAAIRSILATQAGMASQYRDKRITLSVKDKDGSVLFSIKRKTRLRKLMEAFAKRRGTELREIQFQFDGRQIRENQTPREMGIQEGDVINVLPARAKPRESKKRAVLGGIFAPGGNGDEEEGDWFRGRRALAPVLPVDALTGYHGRHSCTPARYGRCTRCQWPSRHAVPFPEAAALRSLPVRQVHHRIPGVCVFYYCRTYYKAVRVGGGGEWGLLEEMAEGLGYDFASSAAAAAATATAAMRRPVEAGDASSHADVERTAHSVVETVPRGLCPGCWCGGLHHQRTQTLAG
jgi:small ubiquitin-related modifier